jgi:thioester reductase-like protein
MLRAAGEAAAEIGSDRIELLAADIGESRLGLEAADYERLRGEVARIYHLAALYNLAVPLQLAQKVNVAGTGNVVEFCLGAVGLERLLYVSTAYVAGRRTGVVYEHELAMGQDFKNHYESTKFQAEVWVQRYLDRVPTTILRPAIVVGDSETGETQKFDGPYYVLRAIAQATRSNRAIPQFGRAEAPFNVVPVDYIVAGIVALAADPAAVGETVHLVDPDPLSARELVAALSQAYAGRQPRGRLSPALVEASLRLKSVRDRLGGTPRESIAYLNHPVNFDTRRAVALTAPHGLALPSFRDYLEPMVEFFREHEQDPELIPG